MGAFQGHLQGDVLSVLLDAGVLFLLRWSLDDTSDGVVAAAIQGFAAVLIVPSDKVHDSTTYHDKCYQSTVQYICALSLNLSWFSFASVGIS